MSQQYLIIGLMSGSSLDGLDAALCSYKKDADGNWSGSIIQKESFSFPPDLENSLRNARSASALELAETDAGFVRFSAIAVNSLCTKTGMKPIAIASHGHTVFHNPASGYTTQIGNGGLLSALTGIPVISDFRTVDVGLGGQGAPLVPGAERFLFSEYDACLNLGGICNVSFPGSSPFLGFDIAPCNQMLNLAASWVGLDFDSNGERASKGTLIPELLLLLQDLPYYKKEAPKSLGNEEVAHIWKPILDSFSSQPIDVMHTVSLHIAFEIVGSVLKWKSSGKMLITGGGAYHSFLINQIRKALGHSWSVELPDSQMISFKEAYCFAFLGLKRILGETNCFAEVTGANADSVCGALYGNLALPQ